MRSTTLIASVAVAFATTAMAIPSNLIPRLGSALRKSTLQARTPPTDFWPAYNGTFTPWKHIGCFSGDVELTYDTKMCSCMNTGWKGAAADLPFTIEKCMARCKGAGFRYAGIKGTNDAKSCWCGSGISDDEKLTTTAKCDVNCLTEAGDKTKGYDTKNCGGLTTWSVYKDPCYKDFNGDAEADNYEPIGCFYYWGGGILTTTIAEVNGDNLSTESCLQACASRGYAYAGTSASALSATWNRGDQCWCGGRVSAYWIQRHKDYPADNTQCTVLCSASEKIKASIQPSDYEYCGNAWYMNIYFNTNLEVSDTCDAGPPPSTTTATRKNKTNQNQAAPSKRRNTQNPTDLSTNLRNCHLQELINTKNNRISIV